VNEAWVFYRAKSVRSVLITDVHTSTSGNREDYEGSFNREFWFLWLQLQAILQGHGGGTAGYGKKWSGTIYLKF
jgi:hypothetical protein